MTNKQRKKILIISPHFPPSNLAAVHRSRLFVQHLPDFGWDPVVLTVDEKYYEEKPDRNLEAMLPEGLRVEKVSAFPVTRPRLIGDIGLRAFFQLYKRAKSVIKREKIDFLYILIPAHYPALLGRWLHATTGVKYGIDYIDPWVHHFPGSEKKFSRHWWSTKLSSILEPIAVKNASLITGVAEGYYTEMYKRNPKLKNSTVSGAMPYGGEIADHRKVREMQLKPYLFQPASDKLILVYAGAMLPKANEPLKKICSAIKDNRELFHGVEFHFIGTGRTTNDPLSHTVKPIAESYGIWEEIIFEHPLRIPYLDVLCHLEAASGVFVLGSTEPHYTPSKVYQGILSGKPLLAVLHYSSTALKVVNSTNAGITCIIDPDNLERLPADFIEAFTKYRLFVTSYNPEDVKLDELEEYSARSVTAKLVALLDKVI